MTSLKQPHFHEDYHRPRANDRRSPPREKKAGADKATDVTDGLFFTYVRRRRLVTTPRVTQRCSIHGRKKEEKKREKESEGPRQFAGSRLKKPKFRRDKASGQRDGANYIHGRRIEFSEATCSERATVFSASTFSPAIAGAVATLAASGWVVRVRQGAAARTLKPTHATTINPSLSTRPPTHYHRQRCRTLSSDAVAVASTTISSSLPPLPPRCHCQRCSANPPILYPSTAIHRHHQYHHLQFSCRWRAPLLLLSSMPLYPPRLPRQVDTDDRYCYPTPSFPSSLSTFELRHPLSKCSFPSLLHLSFECMCK